MKIIKKELPKEIKELIIVPLADLHLGDKLCDIELVKKHIEFIKNNKNAYCVLNGDIINNATKTSVSDVYSEQLTPMEQLKQASDLLKPIKDKILCVTNGNHEARTWKMDGIDLMEILTRELGISDVYSKESAFIFLKVGYAKNQKKVGYETQTQYTIFMNHGSGGGRKEGAKAIRLADMAGICDADIYIHSHTHLPMVMKEAFYRVNQTLQSVNLVDKLFVNTSSSLNYGSYGETYEFKPSSKDTPYIYLSGEERKMKAHL